MKHPPILIVDEHDNPVGEASMDEAHQKGLYHRIVRVMIEDNQGRILLQKRSPHVSTAPNKWDHSAAGHVDVGETNDEAAAREAAEEIGLQNVKLGAVGAWKTNTKTKDGRILNRFNILYKGRVDSFEPSLEEFEVTEVKWFTLDEIKQLIDEHPDKVTKGLVYAIEHFY